MYFIIINKVGFCFYSDYTTLPSLVVCKSTALHKCRFDDVYSALFLKVLSFMKKTLNIANIVALIATIAINYLSNTGLINGNTMKTISDQYANYFTPAGYAFSIWGVIYLGLLGFIFYGWSSLSDKNDQMISKIGWWFVVSCIANSLWVVVWLYDQIGLSVVVMALLLVSLLKIIQNAGIFKGSAANPKTLLCVYWPFSIYFGWVSVAFIADIAAFLTKSGWGGWGIPAITWTVIMLCIAGLVNVLVVHTKKLYAYGLVGMWAVLAISVANQDSNSTILYTCYGVAAVVLAFIVVNLFRRRSVAG